MNQIKARNVCGGKQHQPASEILPAVPFRMIFSGPSGCGKSEAIVSMILDLMRDKRGKSVFSRVYVFSPSIGVDQCWKPVMDFVRKELGVDTDKEPCFFSTFDKEAIQDIKAVQERIVMMQRERKDKTMHGILVVYDDWADDPGVTRHSQLLWSAYVRGRHCFQSTIMATQAYRQLSPIIRKNATDLVIFKQRNAMELKALLEENSAVYAPGVLERMYYEATKEPFSFLYLKLTAKTPEEFAWLRFEEPMYEEGDEPTRVQKTRPTAGGQ